MFVFGIAVSVKVVILVLVYVYLTLSVCVDYQCRRVRSAQVGMCGFPRWVCEVGPGECVRFAWVGV